jgi:hypothetical protein
MLDFRGYKNYAAGGHLAVFRPSLEPSTAADHVIHFVFVVRLLRISTSSRQHIETSTHRSHAEKFFVQLATLRSLLVDFGKIGE